MDGKYYYEEPYLRELDARVVRISERGVVLSETIAYPEGGGQPGDRGTLDGTPFTDTIKEGDEVLHVTSGHFNVGDSVHIVIDWPHRYFYMKMHTCQHLLSGLMFSLYGIGTVAVHQGEDILTIETDRSEIGEETLLEIESAAIKAICENHEVHYLELSHEEAEKLGLRRSIKVEGDVRLVKIEGVDLIACGGLHVASTGEIGEVSYAGSETIRGHVRTIWRCAESARGHRRAESAAMKQISTLFSAKSPEEAARCARAQVEEVKELGSRIRGLERKEAAHLIASSGSVIRCDLPLSAFQNLPCGRIVISSSGGKVTWLASMDEEKFKLFRSKFGILGLKGGGRGGSYQGSAEDSTRLEAWFLEVMNG